MAVLETAAIPFRCVVVDGYVDLGPPAGKGLGRHLWERLCGSCRVIGVAKSPFPAADRFLAVRRGRSRRPLFVSAAGMATEAAVARIEGMHGRHRIPTLIRLADQAARGASLPQADAAVSSRPGPDRCDGAPAPRW
jgi:deoxyribonuclease V